jgi:hypothetical protein
MSNLITIENNGTVQVRQTLIDDKGQESYHRFTIFPGQDVSSQDQDVQNACSKAWTFEVLASWQKYQDELIAEANKFLKI